MRNLIVGTAGHIDHGKTTLVRALTGIDTDRLEEEKRRGISIDLGFAHLQLTPDLRLGFVDVPGHERFVKNMLAGVGGVDLVLLVIAADESIKPQTREHFQICQLLQIPRGIVVLTKVDAVDPEIVELVRLEVEEFVQGSFLEGAPVVAVSATTGEGLDQLRQALAEVAVTVPPRTSQGYLRLPLDRVFSLHGFGTVVTGTLLAGVVRPEQEVETHPGARRLRVRNVQVHGQTVHCATAGQRTALNVTGAEVADLSRGDVLAEGGRYHGTSSFDCRLELLATAKPLKDRAPVHFHAGTAEIEAEVRNLEASVPFQPGRTVYARVKLREPLLLLPGDRFIVRMFSPVVTIGGGVVLDITPPRTKRATTLTRLRVMAEGSIAERVALLVQESAHGLSQAELIARLGLTEAIIEQEAARASLVILREPSPWYIAPEWLQKRSAALRELLQTFHRQQPLLPGMPKEEVRGRLLAGAPTFLLDTVLTHTPQVVAEGEVLRLKSHRLALQQDEEQALTKMEGLFAQAGLTVPALSEVLAGAGVEMTRARSLLQVLFRQQRLVKISEELVFHPQALTHLRGLLEGRKGQKFSVGEFKDWTGVSRKYAIPLLEYLDRQRLTRREGDARIVL